MTTETTRRGSRAAEPAEEEGGRGRTSLRREATGGARRPSSHYTARARGISQKRGGGAAGREEPRVDLLPPEVKSSRRNEAVARRLVFALCIVVLLMGAGIAASTVFAAQSNSALAAAQAETQSLALQQQKYAKVRAIQNQIALTQAGQEVGASSEIDWTAFLSKVRATIGGGLSLTGISIDSASPLAAYQQSTVPLQGARVATVTIDVRAESLDQVSAWLAQLAQLASVADVAPGTVTLDESGYSASAIMHLSESAFDGRFAPKGQ